MTMLWRHTSRKMMLKISTTQTNLLLILLTRMLNTITMLAMYQLNVDK